jgi:hypothetical protein
MADILKILLVRRRNVPEQAEPRARPFANGTK